MKNNGRNRAIFVGEQFFENILLERIIVCKKGMRNIGTILNFLFFLLQNIFVSFIGNRVKLANFYLCLNLLCSRW